MHYALHPRTFFYSHYFYLGLRVAIGLATLTMLTLRASDMATAMTVCIGALCTALMDLPSPLRHKVNEMTVSVLLCSGVTLLISLCAPIPWLLMTMLVVVSFLASMMVVYGKKSLPLQLTCLFMMTMSMEHAMTPLQALRDTALFMGGGLAYLSYAMALASILRHRIKQQVLAEALFELAAYIDIKAGFYDQRHNLSEQFNKLVRHQGVLADRQQASRDLILRSHQNARDAVVVQVHVCMLDLYELVLSTHTDYDHLRTHLADAPVLATLHTLACKAARDIEAVGYAVTRNRASHAGMVYHPELAALDADIARLERRAATEPVREGLAVLRAQRNKIGAIIAMIGQLHLATHKAYGATPFWDSADMTPFLSQQKYELGMLLSHLRLDSPVFRFALRVAMAISTGLLVSDMLPYAAHRYWIVLTIAIILRPTFSMTKQRRADRIIGTVIGCVLTALAVRLVPYQPALLAILFLAMVATPTFIYLRYRYAAIAVSMMILLQMHLVSQGGGNLIAERLVDTLIGAAVATVFSFVLASWEYQSLPRLIREVLDANLRYMASAFDLLQGKCGNDFAYRVQRKGLMDSLAALSSALMRMLDEPAGKRRAVEDINLFIVQNYLLVAHVAALRAILLRHAQELPLDAVNAMLAHSHRQVCHTLSLALRHHAPQPAGAPVVAPPASSPAPAAAGDDGWSGWPLVRRRVRLLQADADKIAVHSAAIVQNVAARAALARQTL
ncbi:MAG: FUSC family membrane protein [Pseudomonadota bacterium]